ncbi:hypothetical protein D3C85_1833730 [compost metagenome]
MNSLFLSIVWGGAADITADLGRSAMLNPKRELHDGGLQGELVFVDLEQQGREQV